MDERCDERTYADRHRISKDSDDPRCPTKMVGGYWPDPEDGIREEGI